MKRFYDRPQKLHAGMASRICEMALSLKETRAIAGLAGVLYDFLPWIGTCDLEGA